MITALLLTLYGIAILLLRFWTCDCLKWPGSQWYFLFFFFQVMLLGNEGYYITSHQAWCWWLVIPHVAMWVCVASVARALTMYSGIRHLAPAAVDQVLDMLLLPINYGFLMLQTVRYLIVNPSLDLWVVEATINTADIWESWALWSVLALFISLTQDHAEDRSGTLRSLRSPLLAEHRSSKNSERGAQAKPASLRGAATGSAPASQ